jgi:hypothetical protein
VSSKRAVLIFQVLRIAVAMCFIGHGAFGIVTKEIWCNYFAVFGIGHDLSYKLMPVVGSADILFGLIMLVYPVRAVPVWLIIWGTVTALCRPLSGEPFAEFIERAGNFGAPLALLLVCGFPKNFKDLFIRINVSAIHADENDYAKIGLCLRITVFLLLLGHGWLNLVEKKGLLDQYTSLGFSDAANVARITGIAEVTAAFLVLIKPFRPFLLGFFIWKMFSELFYPHYELFEWIERGGSYGSILALWILAGKNSPKMWVIDEALIKRQQLSN